MREAEQNFQRVLSLRRRDFWTVERITHAGSGSIELHTPRYPVALQANSRLIFFIWRFIFVQLSKYIKDSENVTHTQISVHRWILQFCIVAIEKDRAYEIITNTKFIANKKKDYELMHVS